MQRQQQEEPHSCNSPGIKTKTINVLPSVQRLIVISDLHGYKEPLAAFDYLLQQIPDNYEIIVNGDLLDGGIDAGETIDWVVRHATGRTIRGNHENHLSRFDSIKIMEDGSWAMKSDTDMRLDESTLHWIREQMRSPESELHSYTTLTDRQIQFIRGLPDQLLVHWRGKVIRVMHGHVTLDGRSVSYMLTPEQSMEMLYDTSVELTVVAHTHFPFVLRRDGCLLANSGSVAVPICRFRASTGQIVSLAGNYQPEAKDDCRSSFLSISEQSGKLNVRIVRFNYDRQEVLERYERYNCLTTPMCYRKSLLLEGFNDRDLL